MPRTRAVFRFLPPTASPLSGNARLESLRRRARARSDPFLQSLSIYTSQVERPPAARGRAAVVAALRSTVCLHVKGCVVARDAPRAMARGGGGGRADGGERETRAVVLARKFGISVKLATTIAWRAPRGDASAAVVARSTRWSSRASR